MDGITPETINSFKTGGTLQNTSEGINNVDNEIRELRRRIVFIRFLMTLLFTSLQVLDGLKLTVYRHESDARELSKILHRIQVRSVREPVHSGHIIVFQPGLGASTGVDCGIILLKS
uniref:Uncharacterized protein n=1 Tax=Heterorhabditis bacteriophora TaxID=37862 RepID=A0A1I7X5R3_HETBA